MGYIGFSMSVNAANAYARGLLPASKAARQFGFKNALAVRCCVHSSEWHHTSKEFNSTDFFDVEEAVAGATWRELAGWKPHLTRSGWAQIKARIRAKLRKQMQPDCTPVWRCGRKGREERFMELERKYDTCQFRRNGANSIRAALTGKALTDTNYLAAKAVVDARREAKAANSQQHAILPA